MAPGKTGLPYATIFAPVFLTPDRVTSSGSTESPPVVRIRSQPSFFISSTASAIDAGLRDVNELTDLAFWMHVPELGGKKIPTGHSKFNDWAGLWTFRR